MIRIVPPASFILVQTFSIHSILRLLAHSNIYIEQTRRGSENAENDHIRARSVKYQNTRGKQLPSSARRIRRANSFALQNSPVKF